MNHLKRLVAIILIVAVTAITAGCSAGIRDTAEHSTTNAVSAAESTESIQPTETDNTAAKASYTMADIKNLKNTEHFAKNTLEHIFDGTINGKGKATGYHYTKVKDSKGRIIEGTRSDVDENGVFTGKHPSRSWMRSTPPITTRSTTRATQKDRSGSATAVIWRSICISTPTKKSPPRSRFTKETDDEIRDKNNGAETPRSACGF